MTQQTMTKEQILEKSFNTLLKAKFGSIVGEFSEANTNNGYEWVFTAMEEYAQQEVAKEREKAKKIEHSLKMCVDALKGLDATDYVAYTAGKVALIEYNNG